MTARYTRCELPLPFLSLLLLLLQLHCKLKLLPNCCTVYEKHINFASALCCCCLAAVTPSTWLLSGTQIAVGVGVAQCAQARASSIKFYISVEIFVNILMRIERKYSTHIVNIYLCDIFCSRAAPKWAHGENIYIYIPTKRWWRRRNGGIRMVQMSLTLQPKCLCNSWLTKLPSGL